MATDLNRILVGDRCTDPALKGRHCRVVATWRRQGPHNVMVEFADGTRTVTPVRCIRRLDKMPQTRRPR